MSLSRCLKSVFPSGAGQAPAAAGGRGLMDEACRRKHQAGDTRARGTRGNVSAQNFAHHIYREKYTVPASNLSCIVSFLFIFNGNVLLKHVKEHRLLLYSKYVGIIVMIKMKKSNKGY